MWITFNTTFAAVSAFIRLGLGSFLRIDPQILRRFIMNFHGRATWPEPFAGSLDPDLERDLSAMLFFFEAYMRPGVWVPYKFRNPGRSHRFRSSALRPCARQPSPRTLIEDKKRRGEADDREEEDDDDA